MSVVKQMFVVLIAIGALAGVVLAGSYKLTEPLIEKHKLEELQQSIFVVLPDAKSYEDISAEGLQVYKGLNDQQELAGYAFIAEGAGFQGKIRMMVGIDAAEQTLLGMRVLEQVETPGLGNKITTENFQQQFTQLSIGNAGPGTASADAFITYVKNVAPTKPNEIQAITGATISSKSVVNILNQSLLQLTNLTK